MVTMTMPPTLYANVIVDGNNYVEKTSINNTFIENTTNITTNKINPLFYVLNEIEKISNQNIEYDTSSMNKYSIGDDMKELYCCYKQQIKINDHNYFFKKDFVYTIKKNELIFIAENNQFNIFGYGSTINEAEQQLYETIDDLWNVYAEEDDENLDQGALELKKQLLQNIRKFD